MTAPAGEVPWSEKYRPRTLDEVAAHGDIIDTSECWRAGDRKQWGRATLRRHDGASLGLPSPLPLPQPLPPCQPGPYQLAALGCSQEAAE